MKHQGTRPLPLAAETGGLSQQLADPDTYQDANPPLMDDHRIVRALPQTQVLPVKRTPDGLDFQPARDFLFNGNEEKRPVFTTLSRFVLTGKISDRGPYLSEGVLIERLRDLEIETLY